ncbi:MAG: HigA family addiction module antitoxin [Candidatus Poribacteria bacterium]|nr:HigA family addiction module antitoxin [Candidatus Poribacteria bacterium]
MTNRIATHPGALLLEQIREMGLTVNGLARDIDLPATRLHEIVHERRGVTAETAIALGEYFDQTPEFWMNAQKTYELSKELVTNGKEIRSRVRRHARDLSKAIEAARV